MSGPLETFRSALRPLHDRIERTVDLIGDDVDLARYDRFLRRSYGFIASCEEQLDLDAAPTALRLAHRLKTDALTIDLRNRGMDPAAVERAPAIPAVHGWPAALGYLYVIEGSTLGGQLLYRHLSTRLDLADTVTHYLRGYGASTGRQWRAFLDVLAPALAGAAGETEVITSTAAETFGLLERFHALE